MIKFSCYNGHIHSLNPKMTRHLSDEAMHKALEDGFDNHGLKNTNSCNETPSHLEPQVDGICITADQATSSSSIDHDWKSDEFKINYVAESDDRTHNTRMKKSQSLGSELFRKGRFISDADSGNETDQGFSGDGSHGQSGSLYSFGEKDPEVSTSDQLPGGLHSVSVQVSSDLVHNGSIFSIGEPEQKVEFPGNSCPQSSAECTKYIPRTPHISNVISKSFSSSNIVAYGRHSTSKNIMARPTSCDDLNDTMPHKLRTKTSQDGEGDNSVENNDKTMIDDLPDDGYDGYNYVGTAKDWIMPDEANTPKQRQLETKVHHWSEFPSKDFKTKRIEEWVSNLQHCTPSEEKYDLSTPCHYSADYGDNALKGLPAARQDTKSTPGMESVKRYISSLSATATSAQLGNHGLVAIPFLSAFVCLKAVNLSGNAIVRITAGALPRGLHVLNLSKNNISTIEGLRELTRLRVLDLSYNRILRIGHGLASCSSLKELYLAGNKISDVEGLHRLLKLNVLDLRFNKISTTKCLGQLAANYNSLQAISLEGNPAQKNVGDDQLKKHLQGLLPLLVYYNRQSMKSGSLKDSSSARLASHQFDRVLRSELKNVRKVNHGVAAHRRTPSLLHGRRNHQAVASAKPARDRHGRLPPSGMKTISRPSFYDFGSRGISFKPEIALHRSRSEGNVRAF